MIEIARRVALFITTLTISYVISVGVITHLEAGGRSVLERLLERDLDPGGYGQTLRRFRDLRGERNLDVLFSGSSHAVRTFDPRVYAESGLKTFNMGSLAQTPFNSYHILEEYLPLVDPKLVIYELYPEAFRSNGKGTTYDIVINTPLSWSVLKMAVAHRDIQILTVVLSTYWKRTFSPLEEAEQADIEGETYIPGGYLSKPDTVEAISSGAYPEQYVLNNTQKEYLRSIVRLVRRQGADILLVSHPLPEQAATYVKNFDQIYGELEQIAREENVSYLNFNGELRLEADKHFYDHHHLNSAGGRLFNLALRDSLRCRFPELFS